MLLATGSASGQDVSRAEASRAQLEAALKQDQEYIDSPGYSSTLRDKKQQEADMISKRLKDGDFVAGDRIALVVRGEQALTDTFTVRPGSILSLPQIPDISLSGILRSELSGYLTEQLSKYIRDPDVQATSLVRLQLAGVVVHPGFFNIPASALLSDAIMAAGGPGPNGDPNSTVLKRGKQTISDKAETRLAIQNGLSIDQLNMQGGDEIEVGRGSGGKSKSSQIIAYIGILSGLVFLYLGLQRVF